MKILFFVAYYRGFTGSQRSLFSMASRLPPEFETKVVFPGHGRAVQGAAEYEIPYRIVESPETLNSFEKQTLKWSYGKRLRVIFKDLIPFTCRMVRVIRQEDPDVIHCNDARSVLMIGPAARLTRKPVVWHVRGMNSTGGSLLLQRLTHGLSSVAITVADALRKELPTGLPARTIYNGVAPAEQGQQSFADELNRLIALKGFTLKNTFVLMTASSLVPYKGHHHLIQALSQIFDQRPQLRGQVVLLVLGDAQNETQRKYKAHLIELATRLGVSDNLIWLGWQQNAGAWMSHADIVALPTVDEETVLYGDGTKVRAVCTEGLPRVVLEAMAAGRAVIASDVAGVKEAVTEQTGILVSPGKPGELVAAILWLIDDEPARLQIGQAAKERARSFSLEASADGVAALYRDLVEGRIAKRPLEK